jgi:hypothetical protein
MVFEFRWKFKNKNSVNDRSSGEEIPAGILQDCIAELSIR